MKPIGEVIRKQNKLGNELKRDFKIQTGLIVTVSILALIVSFRCIDLGIKYEALKLENAELVKANEIKDSIISDLQEDNIKLQEMIDNAKNKR